MKVDERPHGWKLEQTCMAFIVSVMFCVVMCMLEMGKPKGILMKNTYMYEGAIPCTLQTLVSAMIYLTNVIICPPVEYAER